MTQELVVRKGFPEDEGVNKVRLPPEVMRGSGLKRGDTVSIRGKKDTCGMAYEDRGGGLSRDYVRFSREVMRNSGSKEGDTVEVKKAEVKPCEVCKLVPSGDRTESELILSLNLTDFIRERVLNIPVSRDDVLFIGGFTITGEPTSFRVKEVRPPGIVLITDETRLELDYPEEDEGSAARSEKVTYENIGGLRPQLREVREVVELPMKMPDLFEDIGIEPPKGLLLHGPPGTGKTLLTKALAHETGARIFTIRGPEIMESLYGEAERNLRNIFGKAVVNAPSIIFIDELDSIAPKREATYGDVEKRVSTQLLTLMDSLPKGGGVMVVGTSNRPDAIESALRRPGRFDREIELSPPNWEGRREILSIHQEDMPLDEDVDLDELCDITVGYVGADLQALCREAALSALRRRLPAGSDVAGFGTEFDPGFGKERINAGDLSVGMADFKEGLKKVFPTALREITVRIPSCDFDDIGGLKRVKRDLRECVENPFTHREEYRRLGIKTPNGVLLYGPPGTGKTLLARAIAGQMNSSFISVKAPEILNRLVGEAERKLREIFKKARQVAPCIIFFDEVDSIARGRGGSDGDGPSQQNITNQLLLLVDGIERYEDVIVIGATNRPDLLDRAFLRKGRFDRKIFVPPPDRAGRFEILEIHTRNIPLAGDVDISVLAERTEGFSGADIEGLCQEAAIEAFRESKDAKEVGARHFQRVLKRFKPSIGTKTIKYYNSIKKSLTGRLTTGEKDEISLSYT